jgi:carbonic anhydrase/acetyltransferase-like protein (isoleucine patch superfamily)
MIRSFNGRTPRVAESAFVSEAAYVVGDVEIGEGASIWPGTVIRGDTGCITIGRNTSVQDGCIIHSGVSPDVDVTIGDMVQFGHGAVVHSNKIGNNVLIGMNATILHGVEIGNFCIIGAGCLVNAGMKIPDNSFVVGVPGKIKGETTSEQLRWVQDAPLHYAELGKQYKEAGL